MKKSQMPNQEIAGRPNDETEENLLLPLPKWKLWYTMVILYLLYFMDFATRAVISPMFPILKKEMGLSDSQLGWLSTIVLAVVSVLAIPLSYLIDRWSRRKMISLMSIIWSAGSFFSGLSVNFTQLLITRGVLGVGEASFSSAGQAMIMATIKKSRRATVTGIWTTASSLGMACGMLVGGFVAAKYGWQAAFMAVSIPGVILGILAWFIPDFKNQIKTAGSDAGQSLSFGNILRDLVKNKTLVSLCISFGLVYFFCMTLFYWLPSYFIRYMGMDVARAGAMTAGIMVTALIAAPLGGFLGDRISRKNPKNKILLCWISVVAAIITFGLAILLNIWPLFFVVTLFLFLFIPVQQIVCQEIVPFYQRATAYGVYIFSMFFLGGLWGPAVTGMISDAYNLQVAFWVNGAMLLAASLGYLFMFRFYKADYDLARKLESGT
jgi:MFS transporter, Spinster family, sphingosine-1-phosphate transporter